MKVAIDLLATRTASAKRGIGRYVSSLTKAMLLQARGHETFLLLDGGGAVEAESDLAQWAALAGYRHCRRYGHRVDLADSIGRPSLAGDTARAGIDWQVDALDVDVHLVGSHFEGFAESATTVDPSTPASHARVAVLYDLIPLVMREQYLDPPAQQDYARWFQRKLRQLADFDLLLAISESTRQDACRLLGLPDSSIAVIGAGVDSLFTPGDGRSELDFCKGRFGIDKAFVLYPCNGDARKNVSAALEAFASLPDALRSQHRLVLTQVGCRERLDDALVRVGLAANEVVVTGYVSDTELLALLRAATLVVFPSRYEGFGLPVAEAMACGRPVLAGRNSSLVEIVGRGDALFDATNSAEFSSLLARSLGDAGFRDGLARHGLERSTEFRWDRVAASAWAALETLSVPRKPFLPARAAARFVERVAQACIAHDAGPAVVRPLIEPIAASQPVPRAPRLYVDVGELARVDFGTGIQRVVRNVVRELARLHRRGGVDVVPVMLGTNRFVPAMEVARRLSIACPPDIHVEFSQQDALFMLDSSWLDPARFAPEFAAARRAGSRILFAVYDLIPIRHPGTCDPGMPPVFTAWLQATAQWADGYYCISRSTAEDLHRWLIEGGTPRALQVPIGWAHLGADLDRTPPSPSTDATLRAFMDGSPPTYIVVGTLEPRKDPATIAAAFDQLWAEGFQARLAFLGKMGWLDDDFRASFEQRAIGPLMRWFPGLDDGALDFAYRNAAALVQASIAEGYGLPILEAMNRGCPVICSDIPVFREIGGEEVRLFATGDSCALAAAIRAHADMPTESRPTMAGRVRSWAVAAAEIDELLDGRGERFIIP